MGQIVSPIPIRLAGDASLPDDFLFIGYEYIVSSGVKFASLSRRLMDWSVVFTSF